jgi:hypothetical protein
MNPNPIGIITLSPLGEIDRGAKEMRKEAHHSRHLPLKIMADVAPITPKNGV